MASRGPGDRRPSGAQALAALAKGTPESWSMGEGTGLMRRSPPDTTTTPPPRSQGQADPGSESENCPQEVPKWEELWPSNVLQKSERGKHRLCVGSCMGAQEGPAKAAFPLAQPGLQKLEGPLCPFPAPTGRRLGFFS